MRTPPPPDFELRWARAVKRDRERNRHLSEIASLFKTKFSPLSPLDEVVIGAATNREDDKLRFGVTIFFQKDADVAECEANGTNQAMHDFIYEKLEEFGRGKRDELDVEFEFDSFENVQKNYEGSYFLRMR